MQHKGGGQKGLHDRVGRIGSLDKSQTRIRIHLSPLECIALFKVDDELVFAVEQIAFFHRAPSRWALSELCL